MDAFPMINVLIGLLNCGLILSLQCSRKENDILKEKIVSKAQPHECARSCEYPAAPMVCEYIFEVQWFYSMDGHCFDCPVISDDCDLDQCIPVDGTSRPTVITNSTIPGPSIEVCEGDIVQVKLINQLEDGGSISIHWYGMHQEGTNWMDGVPMITQCPVVAKSTFWYEFEAKPAGTHWWHATSGYKRDDGMYGSLIVRQSKEDERNSNTYDYDLSEHVIMLADWGGRPAMSTLLMSKNPTQYVDPNSQTYSMLVNGKARQVSFQDKSGKEYFTSHARFDVDVGKTYRFRLINAVFGLCNIQATVESHSLTIIAVDGAEIEPKEVDSIVIAPGERYDFLIKTTAETSNYCMFFVGTTTANCVADGVALLHYNGHGRSHACTLPGTTLPITDTPRFSILDSQPLGYFDHDLYNVDTKYYMSLSKLTTKCTIDDGRFVTTYSYQIDNVNFMYPTSPLLSMDRKYLVMCDPNTDESLYSKCAEDICSCTSLLKIPLNQVVELVVFNDDEVDYSMHMHGTSFRVLAQDNFDVQTITKDYVKALDNEGMLARISPSSALVKDTVIVPAHGYAILRWKVENAGVWLFHSQTDLNLKTGQATILQFGLDSEVPLPPMGLPTCGAWSLN